MTLTQWILQYDETHRGGFTRSFQTLNQWQAEFDVFKSELEKFRREKERKEN